MQRLPDLRSRLVLLAAASIVPVLLLSLTLGYFLIQHQKDMFRQAAVDRNRTFLTALDAQIEGVDIGLPDIDGYEVARRLRALALSNPPKLIAISGFGQQSDLHRAYEAGFDLHLTKPVSPRFLQDVMGAITSRNQFGAPGPPH